MNKRVNIIGKIHKETEWSDTRNFRINNRTYTILCKIINKRINFRLFDAQRNTAFCLINISNYSTYNIIFLIKLFRIYNFLYPRNFSGAYKTFYSVLDLSEYSETCYSCYSTLNFISGSVFFINSFPRVSSHLLDSKSNLSVFKIHGKNLKFAFITDFKNVLSFYSLAP